MSEEAPKPIDPRVGLAGDRTSMASFRTRLALDRTTLAWLRTTLTMGSFGFGMVGFFRSLHEREPTAESARLHAGAIRMGTALFVLAIVATVLAAAAHWFMLRKLRRGQTPVVTQWPLSITVAMLFAVIGLAGLWALFSREQWREKPMRTKTLAALTAALLALCGAIGLVQPQDKSAADPLPSWNDGPARKAILEFMRATTDKASAKYVPPAERIATFDNDGTLWVEQPLYTQLVFSLDRVKALAAQHPDWDAQEPFKAILAGDREAMARLTKKEFLQIFSATHSGMSTDQFDTIARTWLATAKHPRYKRLYTECIYQPMLEVLRYLRANGFKTYIVTGGGQAFVRTFGAGLRHSARAGDRLGAQASVHAQDGKAVMLRLPTLLLLDDEDGKPEDIELFIGRKPLAAFGNSDGDRQMLEWTQSGPGLRLKMLVHHDDDQREYSYGAKSTIGTFSDSLMAEAHDRGWNVISMKNEWKRVFPFEAGSN